MRIRFIKKDTQSPEKIFHCIYPTFVFTTHSSSLFQIFGEIGGGKTGTVSGIFLFRKRTSVFSILRWTNGAALPRCRLMQHFTMPRAGLREYFLYETIRK